MTDPLSRVQLKVRPPIPDDNLCENCKKNIQQYIKKNRYLCRYCWDRDEYSYLANLTDQELDTLKTENLKKIYEDNKSTNIVNTKSLMGF